MENFSKFKLPSDQHELSLELEKQENVEEEQDHAKAVDPRMSRRGFVFGSAAAAAGATAVGAAASGKLFAEESKKELVLEKEEIKKTHFEKTPVGPFDTGELAGRKVADLFAFYLGLPEGSAVPEKLDADFEKILQSLWDKKKDFVSKRKANWLDNTTRAEQLFTKTYQLARKEGSAEYGTVEDLIGKADTVIADTNASINWNGLKDIPDYAKFTDEDVQIVKSLAQELNGTMLLAYSITELMPSLKDSKTNVDVYSFLAKNAGTDFLQRIPAIHDPYLSAGMYQFTSYALFDNGEEAHGASLINKLVTDENKKIPSSVIFLQSFEQQTRAAYLFAIENIARLVKDIASDSDENRKIQRLERLQQTGELQQIGLLQYIASAHHLPAGARDGYEAWIDQNFQGSHADCCKPQLADYIRKSNGNYLELVSRTTPAPKTG